MFASSGSSEKTKLGARGRRLYCSTIVLPLLPTLKSYCPEWPRRASRVKCMEKPLLDQQKIHARDRVLPPCFGIAANPPFQKHGAPSGCMYIPSAPSTESEDQLRTWPSLYTVPAAARLGDPAQRTHSLWP